MSDTARPARGRPRTMNAQAVLDVTVDAYLQSDPADVSVNTICQMAGVSKPSLYREFGSEDGLARAALDTYAERVLSDIFAILHAGHGMRDTLDALIAFASTDPRMETGCLFYKMRAGKHRLGPQTRARVEEINAAATEAFETFLKSRRAAGDWKSDHPADMIAGYIVDQIGLAFAQRASGDTTGKVQAALSLALSVVHPR